MKKWILLAIVVLTLLAFLAGLYAWWRIGQYALSKHPGEGKQIAVDIPAGAGPQKISALLEANGVIDDREDFYRFVRYVARKAGMLKAGELAFRDDMTPEEVLLVLLEGTPITHRVTVPEGLRLDEIAQIFVQAGLAEATAFERRARDPVFAQSLGVPHDSLEGFLLPETYQFRKDTPQDEILRTMVEAERRAFQPRFRERATELGLTELQVVTLAAIVEKETSAPAERPLISGVFHNRLKRGWKLQTDPTVIYAEILATGRFDGTIHRSDLERDHPYNTYRYAGLPPGPICSPGAAALEAALYPTATDNMYFVSKNDGTHQFCATLGCHNAAVLRYQRGGRP